MSNKPATNLPLSESQLSRADIELLSGLKGGMETLVQQVNSIQTTMVATDEARRENDESRRKEHNDQMKEINTQVTELQTWRAMHVTPDHLAAWNTAADQQKDLRRVWIITTAFIGLVGTAIGIFLNQILSWVNAIGK